MNKIRNEYARPARSADLIGWREWASLPDLGIDAIKAKVDTGARSSSLHAHKIEFFTRDDQPYVRFRIHPQQRTSRGEVTAEAALLELRNVRNSGGTVDRRPVIETRVALGRHMWNIELTLTARDDMGFRMLLGRQAVRGKALIDSGRSFVLGRPTARKTE